VRAHGGLGLGLAIVEFLVRQQSGTVKAESEGAGKGATFTVEFPLVSHEVVSHVHQPASFGQKRPKRWTV
jgi:signal transduction histidine kinase